jgi:hypothetical protein
MLRIENLLRSDANLFRTLGLGDDRRVVIALSFNARGQVLEGLFDDLGNVLCHAGGSFLV